MESGLRIGDVAKQTGLTVDAIRFYEREQLLKSAQRSEGGFRLFAARDIETVLFIRRAQELGFSLKEIRELLLLQSEELTACSHVRDLLQAKLDAVKAKIRDLKHIEQRLAADLKKCDSSLLQNGTSGHGRCPVLTDIATTKNVRPGGRR